MEFKSFSEATAAMQRHGDALGRLRDELSTLNDRIETKSARGGSVDGLRKRAANVTAAIDRASDQYGEAKSAWDGFLRNRLDQGAVGSESGDGARRDAGGYVPRGTAQAKSQRDRLVGQWLQRCVERKAWLNAPSGSNDQAFQPPEHASTALDFLAASTVLDKAGVTEHRTNRRELRVPHLLSDAASGWYGEMDQIAATDSTAEEVILTPQRVSVRSQISNEALADSSPDARTALGQALLRSVALSVDKAGLEGTGSNNQPTGLKNVTGKHDLTLGSALTNLDVIAEAIEHLLASDVDPENPLAIIMHPRTWGELLRIKENSGSNLPLVYAESSAPAGQPGGAPQRKIYGQSVYLSSQLSTDEGEDSDASSIYVFDPKEFIVCYGQYSASVEVDSSRLFDLYASELRAVARAAFGFPNPKALARIAGVRPASAA